MSTNSELLGQAIAVLNLGQFEDRFSSWLRDAVRYDNFVVIAYFQDQPPKSLYSDIEEPNVLKNFESLYTSGAYLLDPFYSLHVKRLPQGLYRLSDIEPDQFRRNRYYREYYQNTTMVDEIAFICYPNEGVSIHVSLGRDAISKKRYSNKEIATAKMIAPIVCALGRRHWSSLNSTGTYDETQVVENLIEKTRLLHQIKLSPRQAEVALLILRGHSSVSIGLQLGVSPQTVKVFRKQLYKKCKISSQAELFNFLMPILQNGRPSSATRQTN